MGTRVHPALWPCGGYASWGPWWFPHFHSGIFPPQWSSGNSFSRPLDSLQTTAGFPLGLMRTIRCCGIAAIGGDHHPRRDVVWWQFHQPVWPSFLLGVLSPSVSRCDTLVGNGFHLPSVMMLMCLLPALMEAKFNPGPTLAEMDSLPARVAGTIFGSLVDWKCGQASFRVTRWQRVSPLVSPIWACRQSWFVK